MTAPGGLSGSRRPAVVAIGLSLLCALGLLETVAGDGGLALGAVGLLLLLGALGGGAAARQARPPLLPQLLQAATPALGAAAAVVVVARGALPVSGPPGLATVARGVALLGATLLPRTAPALLPLHALGVLMVLWTSAALEPQLDLTRALAALATLVLLAQGLALGRGLEAQAEADLTAGVGQGPSLGGPRASPWPALCAAALAALPAGLGVAVPRPVRGGDPGPSVAHARREAGTVRFAPELRLDRPRGPLREDERVIARLTADPEPPTLFLWGAALPRLTEAGFFPASGPEPEPLAGEEVPVLLTVDVEGLEAGYLPVAGRVIGWAGIAPRGVPGGFAAPEEVRWPLRYQARCLLPDPARELELYAARREPAWLEVPDALRGGALEALAAEAVVGDSSAERARNVVHWLQGRCRYDLRAGARGTSVRERLESFLQDERRGVCTEFAAAMAVLLRLAGEPARVVTGWRVIERDQDDRRVIRERHAHAWVELPLEGAGWVPFDPTPDPPWSGPAETNGGPAETGPAEPAALEPAAGPAPEASPRSAVPSASPLAGAGLALLFVALTGGGVAHRAARRRRWAAGLGAGPRAAWQGERERLFGLLAARGFLPGRAETPLEWMRALPEPRGAREAAARAALAAALEHYTALRFSGRLDPDRHQGLVRALEAAARG